MCIVKTDEVKTCVVTGAAGFIGFYVSQRLLLSGYKVIGIDNINNYYDIALKHARLDKILGMQSFTFVKADISDKQAVDAIFEKYQPDKVIHLAAQAGVRYSVECPQSYITSNIIGFFNILEACRSYPVEHLIYASSSSVYGFGSNVPFRESDFTDAPVSLYAATKKSNELMAFAYSHLYGICATGLRFFTVYGPMGRPDMSYFSFANSYFKQEAIRVFCAGDNELYRDFTYVEDVAEAVHRLVDKDPSSFVNNDKDSVHRVINIGNNRPERLTTFIGMLEKALGSAVGHEVVFKKSYEPLRAEDVRMTYASNERLMQEIDYKPVTGIEVGLDRFAKWYVEYYNY